MMFLSMATLLLIWNSPVAAEMDSCTSVGVTRSASADGSTIVTHNADCVQCDSRIIRIPARDWPAGTMRPIYSARLEYPREVSTHAEDYLPKNGQVMDTPAGFIPEVPHTYAYWEAIYGYQNEHGLGLGESTAPSNFPVEREGIKALMWIRPLTQLAMERCKTVQCAIELMGSLSEEYGFYGEDPGKSGAAECLMLGDGKEVWVFEVTGDPTQRSAFWVAARVPEGHVAALANNMVIREVDCDDTENFRCSTDLYGKLKAEGIWDGVGRLDWLKTVAPDIRVFSYTAGNAPIPFYTTARIWRIFSQAAPSLQLKLTNNPYDLPFSVKADTKLTHRQVMDLKRDHYEGTQIDLTVGPAAGPFSSPYRIEGGAGLKISGGQFARAIALQRTSYGTVIQSWDQAVQLDKMWVATDTPGSSVYVPFYTNASGYSASYRTGHILEYNTNSAWWVFDFVANWMGLNYGMMRQDVTAKIAQLQDALDAGLPAVERDALLAGAKGGQPAAAKVLSGYQTELQDYVVNTWRNFSNFLIMKYNDGVVNSPAKIGEQYGYPLWWLQTFCVDTDIHPKWAQASITPPSTFKELGQLPVTLSDEEISKFPQPSCPVVGADSAELAVMSGAGAGGEEKVGTSMISAALPYLGVFFLGLVVGSQLGVPGRNRNRGVPLLDGESTRDHYIVVAPQ